MGGLSSFEITYAVVLKRLHEQGFITGEEAFSTDAPTRTIYHITPAGQAHMQAWLDERHPPPSVRRVRVECLSRLYVARLLEMSISDILQHQKTSCEYQYQQLIAQREPGEDNTGRLALELEIAQIVVTPKILVFTYLLSNYNYTHKRIV